MKKSDEKVQNKAMFYVFFSFHYDVVYRGTYEFYLEKAMNIIHKGLEFIKQYPGFVFVIEQTIVVEEFWNRFPESRKILCKAAKSRRLIFAPGMYVMPDSNIPSGESWIQNSIIGHDWLYKNLKIRPRICWMADIFGHNSQTPQMAKTCGYKEYMFMRGMPEEKNSMFWWEGLDGSRILAYWQIDTYGGLGYHVLKWFNILSEKCLIRRMEENVIKPLMEKSSYPYEFLTSIGGDFLEPKKVYLDLLKKWNKNKSKPNLVLSSPEKFFDNIRHHVKAELQIVKSEFNPLFQGTYSSRIRLKQANRRLENIVAALEILEVANEIAGLDSYKNSKDLWKIIAFNSSHDVICGSISSEALKECLKKYSLAEKKYLEIINNYISLNVESLISRQSEKSGTPLVLFNSLPCPRHEIVEIPLKMTSPGIKDVILINENGEEILTQLVNCICRENETIISAKLLAEIDIPSMCIKTYYLKYNKNKRKRCKKNNINVKKDLIENEFIKIKISNNGTIISFIDKENNYEYVPKIEKEESCIDKGMNNIIIQPDYGDPWTLYKGPVNVELTRACPIDDPMPPSRIESYGEKECRYSSDDANCFPKPEIQVIENGPLRVCLEISYGQIGDKIKLGNLRTQIYLNKIEKQVNFETTFIPKGKKFRIRVAFPTNIERGKTRHSIPFGCVERPDGEYPSQDWIDYYDEKKGICLLNKGLPGNNVNDGTLLLSLFRSVVMEDTDIDPWHEQNIHQKFYYAIVPFKRNDLKYDPASLGERFNRPIFYAFPTEKYYENILVNNNKKNVGVLNKPFISVEGIPVKFSACRWVNGKIEVRFYECYGNKGNVKLYFSREVYSCKKVKATGEQICKIKTIGNNISLRIKPFEIITLHI